MLQKKRKPNTGTKNSIKRKLQISIAALSTIITLLFGTVNSIIVYRDAREFRKTPTPTTIRLKIPYSSIRLKSRQSQKITE